MRERVQVYQISGSRLFLLQARNASKSKEAVTLGYILLTDTQTQSRSSTDTHRQFRALAAGCGGAECDPRKELGGALAAAQGRHRRCDVCLCKQTLNAIPIFCFFFHKSENSLQIPFS